MIKHFNSPSLASIMMFGWKTIQFWESSKDKMLSKTAQEEQQQDAILAFKWPSSCWTNKLLQNIKC